MRTAVAPIILLQVCLFLAASIRADEKADVEFNGIWHRLIETLNKERSECDNIGMSASIDLFTLNEKQLKEDDAFSRTLEASNETSALTQLARDVLREINANRVVSSANIYEYDNGERIGFCFGRALAVHYLLLKAGVKACDVYKIFAIGELFVNFQFWKFHVAVLVRDIDNRFVVVDPSFGEPMSVGAWINSLERYDIKYPQPRTRFFVTDPGKFLPSSGVYDLKVMQLPLLRAYFTALGTYLLSI